jgi:UDP-2,4-diacetamido-2,4,6-trideoxy-beta-L-altropyranose hydrolase
MSAVLFLTEGGASSGLGHLRRCATLASSLVGLGLQPVFRVDGGVEACEFVRMAGFPPEPVGIADGLDIVAVAKSCNAEAVVFDTYAATDVLLQKVNVPTVVIDDLADRHLPADIVLNSSLSATLDDYAMLTPATLLLGPQYALLRPEFTALPLRPTEQHIRRVLVTFGGGKRDSLVWDVLTWCRALEPNVILEVALGPFTNTPEEVTDTMKLLRNTDMVSAMSRADLAISAGGQTLFELAAAGVPALAIGVAENQNRNLRDFADAGTIVFVGNRDAKQLQSDFFAAFEVVRGADARRAMSIAGRALVDGQGAERAAAHIANLVAGGANGADL